MAFRRPRVKVVANIRGASVRRKLKQSHPSASEATNTTNDGDPLNESESELNNDVTNDCPKESLKEIKNEIQDNKIENPNNFNEDKNADDSPPSPIGLDAKKSQEEADNYHNATDGKQSSDRGEILPEFKRPANVDNRSNTSLNSMEGNVLQSDLQKTIQPLNTSPTKQCRQRIRPTPAFGQRRNSLMGSTSNEEQSYGDANAHLFKSDRNNTISTITTSNSRVQQKNAAFTSSKTNVEQPVVEANHFTSSDNVIPHKMRKTEEHSRMYRQQSRRDFDSRFCNGAPEKSAFKMSDLIYYNPERNPMEYKSGIEMENSIASNDLKSEASTDAKSENDNDSNVSTMPVPQLKLNANGELILDDESLVIETTAEQTARKILANSSVVYHDENTVSSSFRKRKKRSREWDSGETIKFYRCLQTIGTDFSLMVSLFPNRTRRDLKVKFKKEERVNGSLINKALLHPKQFNVDEMQRQIKIDQEEHLAQLQQIRVEKARKKRHKKIKQKNKPRQSAAGRVLNGEDIYELDKQENENSLDDVPPQQHVDDVQPELSVAEANDKETNNAESAEFEDENQLLQLLKEALEDDNNSVSVTEESANRNEVSNSQSSNNVPKEDAKALAIESKSSDVDNVECDVDEDDIQNILNELAENNFVLVSTTDPDNPNVTINEVYKVDKESGDLCDEPLNIPDSIIQSISSIMG